MHMRQSKKLLLSITLAILGFINTAQAQTCPTVSYAAVDRASIKNILSGPITSSLSRMKEISYFGGSYVAPLVSLALLTQRAAFENEYQAHIAFINAPSAVAFPTIALRPRSRAFLAAVLNSANLGLTGSTMTGATQALAEANSDAANAASSAALQTIWSCF